jgi:hypothetical protein
VAPPASVLDIFAFAKDGVNPGLLDGYCLQLSIHPFSSRLGILVRNRRSLFISLSALPRRRLPIRLGQSTAARANPYQATRWNRVRGVRLAH